MDARNNGAMRKPSIPLEMVDDAEETDTEETYIVVGEAGEEVAFEICEDLEIALGVRDAMQEDGFAVRMFQAYEFDVVEEDVPSTH
jgi:hypothetical protein